jgi:hypothetical protein
LKTALTNAIDKQGIAASQPGISDDDKLPSRIRTKMVQPKLIASTIIDNTNNAKTDNEAVDVVSSGSESLLNTSGDEKQQSRIRSTLSGVSGLFCNKTGDAGSADKSEPNCNEQDAIADNSDDEMYEMLLAG